MDFFNAVKLAEANEHLVGKVVNRDVIEEIIIMPTDEREQELYKQYFVQYMDAQRAIAPFMTSDVDVYALFQKHLIRTTGFFVVWKINNLPREIGVVKDI